MTNQSQLRLLVSSLLLLISGSLSAQQYTVSGYLTDASNGESLIGAFMYLQENNASAVTNEYGFFSITTEAGSYTLVGSYLGYQDVSTPITLNQNQKVDVELPLDANTLDEIVVSAEAKDKNVKQLQMSVNKLDMKTINKLPTLLGETDIIRSIQLLPGVTTVGEGSAGFNVRGGSIDQNLVLLDESPVYNSSHLFGFFSVFNPDAVKDVQLYKGGIPARYGGRLSSILDVRMKEGNNKQLEVNGGVGTIFSRLAVEAPIVKDKTGTYRWNHLFSDKLFSNLTLYYSDYDYQINFGDTDEDSFDWNARIKNYSVKPEFSYFIRPNNILRFGGQSIFYTFEPANAISVSGGEVTDISLTEQKAIESNIFVENEVTLWDRLSLNYGVRLSNFVYQGPRDVYFYNDAEILGEQRPLDRVEAVTDGSTISNFSNLEPRLSAKFDLNDESSLKASYNRTAQYIHLLSNTTASTPLDIWTPSTNNIDPAMADQIALGYFRNFKDNTYEFSTEIYYKTMDNLVDYIDGADLILNEFLEGQILPGMGYYQQGYFVPNNPTDGRNNLRIPDYHRLDLSLTIDPRPGDRKWKGQWVINFTFK